MNIRQTPKFRYDPERRTPKTPDWPLLAALGTITVCMLSAMIFVVIQMISA
jgi:hypothetical protein